MEYRKLPRGEEQISVIGMGMGISDVLPTLQRVGLPAQDP